MANFQAFDAFIEETEETTQKIKGFEYKGEQFTLPQDLPAKIGLQITRRMNAKNTEQEHIDSIEWLLTSLLGKEDYSRLLDTNIGTVQLVKLMGWILQQYGMQTVQKDDETNPLAAKRGKK